MRAIAFAILFGSLVLVVQGKNNGGESAPGWNILAMLSLTGAVVCIIGGW